MGWELWGFWGFEGLDKAICWGFCGVPRRFFVRAVSFELWAMSGGPGEKGLGGLCDDAKAGGSSRFRAGMAAQLR